MTWCNRHRCGPEGHILLWCVWERPWSCQAGTDRSLPLFTRLNHYLLRQEGHMQDSFICSSRTVSATHLWLWRIGFLFFPQGQVSKSGRKLKHQTFRWTGPASETAASLSCLDALAPSPPGKKWYNSTTMLMKSRLTWWKMKGLKSANELSIQTKK